MHLFTIQAIPEKFFGWAIIMKLMRSRVGLRWIRGLLRCIGPFSKSDRFDRMAAFAGIAAHRSQEEIFELLQGYYPSGTSFIVLPMDFEYMGAGRPVMPYLDQLGELRHMKRAPLLGARLHPFVAVDPRREGIVEMARSFIENHGFSGIKIYPPLGFFPYDERLMPLWEWAEENQVPVMAHCARSGVYYRGSIGDIAWPDEAGPKPGSEVSNARWTDLLSEPTGYRRVLKRYPNLKICLAHMGGIDECRNWISRPWPEHLGEANWLSSILGLIKEFPNVYTDVSYTGHDPLLHPLIDVLVRDARIGSRILYGSDFYMVQQDVTEREFSIRMRSALTEEGFHRISVVNPDQFLSLNQT